VHEIRELQTTLGLVAVDIERAVIAHDGLARMKCKSAHPIAGPRQRTVRLCPADTSTPGNPNPFMYLIKRYGNTVGSLRPHAQKPASPSVR
jgi:hypothetical protein